MGLGDDAAMAAILSQMAGSGPTLADFAENYPATAQQLRRHDPVLTAACFGALLTRPDLLCNTTRLEVLVHLAVSLGQQEKRPQAALVRDNFNALGKGYCGQMEDPAEDVFVGLVRTPRGPFRVLEGLWESSSFFLQRIVNVVEAMPSGGGYDYLRDAIYALLALSELVCSRADLPRYALGADRPAAKLPPKAVVSAENLIAQVRFTREELEEAGIDHSHLAAFVFDPDDREPLLRETLGNTKLERCPIAVVEGELYLLLPSAVSLAIRRFALEFVDQAGMRNAFLAGIGREYSALFSETRLLGGAPGPKIEFSRQPGGRYAGFWGFVDKGRCLSFIFLVDELDGFEESGFTGVNPDPGAAAATIDEFIKAAAEEARKDPEFRGGMTVVVGCGIGRGAAVGFGGLDLPDWHIVTISAADLVTLSWLPEFRPLSLWRLWDAQKELRHQGVDLQNINGPLNLIAWARQLDGHLVPHGSIPEAFTRPGARASMMVTQNALLELRQQVLAAWDPHMQRDVDGKWRNVRREGMSLFDEDATKPLFATEDALQAIYVTSKRTWWADSEVPPETSGEIRYQRWKTSAVWLERAARVLEDALPNLPEGPLLWRTSYAAPLGSQSDDLSRLTYEEALEELRVEATGRAILVHASAGHERAHLHVDNIAERSLVARLVEGAAILAEQQLTTEEREAIVDRIVPNSRARQQHAFINPSFRDYVRDSIPPRAVVIDQMDDATVRLGMGWKVREPAADGWIRGKPETTGFLNSLARQLEDELIEELGQYNRRAFLELVLRNYEAGNVEKDQWARTAAALVALHDDKAAVRERIARYEFKLNAVFQMSRILVEIGVCACAVEGGLTPGELDLSRLMAKAAFIFNVGGWSDAIHYDVMEPVIRVTPLGDVHANFEFVDQIVEPFSLQAADARLEDAIEGYHRHLEKAEALPRLSDFFEAKFEAAFFEEVGCTPDELRLFVEYIEDLGHTSGEAVIVLRRSELLDIRTDLGELPVPTTERILQFFTLKSRPSWRDVPEGYKAQDLFPWRFRRRLALLRRPLLELDDSHDPLVLFAPGLVREAFAYTLGNYHAGSFPEYQLSPKMKAWAGVQADKRGAAFAKDVADRLRQMGWQTATEIKITKILRKRLDRDYGDVDVLAWHPTTNRVLVIECKDVQYKKTYGEVAEQLADFRGVLRPNGKPDYLLLHLNRMDLLTNHLEEISAFTGIRVENPESLLVFRNPVPMAFALDRLQKRVAVTLYDDLGRFSQS